MKLSLFGEKFTRQSGIFELMHDLGTALNENPDMLFMGGGNPAHLKPVEEVFAKRLSDILADEKDKHSLLGIYQSPQGDKEFRDEIAAFLKKQYGWNITGKNIAVSNGSQAAFFILYNMFAGDMTDGTKRSIHLPLTPEYLGYADTGLGDNFFTATKPSIEMLDDVLFKYRVDFDHLSLDANTAALCVSRPTNPTGNVLTDNEVLKLDVLAKKQDVPFIIDGAYGVPFPNIMFADAEPHWNNNIILALSLSKLGLPGVRTGIIVAREDIIEGYTNANTAINLACGTLGPILARKLFETGEIVDLSNNYIAPFYRERSQQTVKWFRESFEGLPVRIHKPEGAIFLWLWFEGLPITSQELYERLKRHGVLIVPGHNFFIGLEGEWQHRHECIRVSYGQDERTVLESIRIITEEVKSAYA